MNILKLAPIPERFSPGFLSGAGFPGEQFTSARFLNPGGAPLRIAISSRVGKHPGGFY
jgi:hypothetical protein